MWVHIGAQSHANCFGQVFKCLQGIYHELDSQLIFLNFKAGCGYLHFISSISYFSYAWFVHIARTFFYPQKATLMRREQRYNASNNYCSWYLLVLPDPVKLENFASAPATGPLFIENSDNGPSFGSSKICRFRPEGRSPLRLGDHLCSGLEQKQT